MGTGQKGHLLYGDSMAVVILTYRQRKFPSSAYVFAQAVSEVTTLPLVGEAVHKKMLEGLLGRRTTFLFILCVFGNVLGIRSRFIRRWRNNLVLVENQVCQN